MCIYFIENENEENRYNKVKFKTIIKEKKIRKQL
jgi:hypothetical protein